MWVPDLRQCHSKNRVRTRLMASCSRIASSESGFYDRPASLMSVLADNGALCKELNNPVAQIHPEFA